MAAAVEATTLVRNNNECTKTSTKYRHQQQQQQQQNHQHRQEEGLDVDKVVYRRQSELNSSDLAVFSSSPLFHHQQQYHNQTMLQNSTNNNGMYNWNIIEFLLLQLNIYLGL